MSVVYVSKVNPFAEALAAVTWVPFGRVNAIVTAGSPTIISSMSIPFDPGSTVTLRVVAFAPAGT